MIQSFNILESPLSGANLIEASAGTGKTYTLEGLFVRLVLEQGLTVDQILVVTYTRKAVDELKSRIRKKLIQVRDGLSGADISDPFVASFLSTVDDPFFYGQRAENAILDFDQSAIFTIHGFCQRVLREQAFETGSAFDGEILTDPSRIILGAANDFWRHKIYPAPEELAFYATRKLKGPESFAELYGKKHNPDIKVLPEPRTLPIQNLEPFRIAYEALKNAWSRHKSKVLEALKSPALSGTSYGALKENPDTPGITNREIKVGQLAKDMDRFTAKGGIGIPLFDKFELFTASKIQAAATKKQTPPVLDFFSLSQNLFDVYGDLLFEFDRHLLFLKSGFFIFAENALREMKQKSNLMDYDDMLVRVRDALSGDQGMGLARTLQDQYKTALLDEFQDTDSIQYKIFSSVFGSPGHLLYMIGDPKQAIYGFRGADVFSYMKAVDQADQAFTLTKNWRSKAALVRAVNTLFSNRENPFIFSKIPFLAMHPGKTGEQGREEDAGPAMTLWHLFSDERRREGKSIPAAEATEWIAEAVAGEIRNLTAPGPNHVPSGDIAVLVRTNRQALIVKRHLSEVKVPSVLYDSGHIFDTHEAMELRRILRGLSEPAGEKWIKSALATQILGGKGEVFDETTSSTDLEDCLGRMRNYALAWKHSGFTEMFRRLMVEEGIKKRLMLFPDGERRLTNLLHLAEMLHQAEIQEGLGAKGLVKWLDEKSHSPWMESEDHLLRLEKDALAVKIVTIHKSKGLEYPVVFCPFAWEGAKIRDKAEFQYHDPNLKDAPVLVLGSENGQQNRIMARKELLAENIRLYYVALTRAKNKCYLAWGRIKDSETSAPAYLFHYDDPPDQADRLDLVTDLSRSVSAKTDEDLLADLKSLALKSQGALEVVPLPLFEPTAFPPVPEKHMEPDLRIFKGSIHRTWRITSYSSLTSGQEKDGASDRDDPVHETRLDWEPPREEASAPPEDPFNILHFPKGTGAGIFFHDLLENMDFNPSNSGYLEEVVEKKLAAFGFGREWKPGVVRMVENLLNAPLLAEDPGFKLRDLTAERRNHEMEFYYPVEKLTPKILQEVFPNKDSWPGFHPEDLRFAPVDGFMRGFIDMVFFHHGRYYIVDWKSNFLGPSREDYFPEAILRAMAHHQYFIQYHIYAVALHQYLSSRLAGYDYGNHFGGVYYLFIRGIDPRGKPENGIFFHRSDIQSIRKLVENISIS
jgi:exodeoxyribonuclease V beta subunit